MRRAAFRLLAVLFIITGATALIAEQAYEKLLETLVGTSTYAAATVLSIYFAGLTLGGWAYRFWRRLRVTPLMLYAILEFGIGAWALLMYAGFEHLITAFVPFLRLGSGNLARLQVLRFVTAAVWILPPTILMGSTFPAIVDALREQFDNSRRMISIFYALNLLGATLAAAAGPYVVFATIGVDGALLVTAFDIVVAIVAVVVARKLGPAMQSAEPLSEEQRSIDRRGVMLIAVAAVCGFLFFSLEVIWTHLIAAVCGNSVYSFASMLTMVLAGLFIGGVIASALAPSTATMSAAVPAFMFLGGAITIALQQIAWPYVPHRFSVWGGNIHTFAGGEMLRALITALLLIPPSAILGTVFPLLFRLRDFPAREQGRAAGAMTAANAIGCCTGAVVAAFVVLPDTGSGAALLVIAVAYAIAGVLMLTVSASRQVRIGGFATAAIAVLLVGLAPRWDRLKLTTGENVYFNSAFVRPTTVLEFFHEDAAGGMTTVIRDTVSNSRVLLTNGKFQGSNKGEELAQISFGMIPTLFVHRLDDVLVIGLGTGQSAGVVQAEGFRHVHVAEIAPGILAAARFAFSRTNYSVLDQPNVTVNLEDGRNLLLLQDQQYDLITMELTSIWFAGATNLYSQDFYKLAAQRLRPGGVLQQWIQLHHTSPREVASTLLTMRSAFPFVSFWWIGDQGIAVGSREPQVVRKTGLDAAQRVLARTGLPPQTLCAIAQSRLLAPEDVDRLRKVATAAVINTDRNRWIEYQTPRYNLLAVDMKSINERLMRQFARPAPTLITGEADAMLRSVCASSNVGR